MSKGTTFATLFGLNYEGLLCMQGACGAFGWTEGSMDIATRGRGGPGDDFERRYRGPNRGKTGFGFSCIFDMWTLIINREGVKRRLVSGLPKGQPTRRATLPTIWECEYLRHDKGVCELGSDSETGGQVPVLPPSEK